MNEVEIIQFALESLEQKTGITGYWEELQHKDGIRLIISIRNNSFIFSVEAKREVRPQHIQNILKQKERLGDLIVVAERIFQKAKAELRELSIPYIEANGNVFIKKSDTLIWIDTNPPLKIKRETGNRAFTKTGLKVLFHFLMNESLINTPQRQIAGETGVSLGNVPQIISGLIKTGHLFQLNKDTYAWAGHHKLLERWITEYETVLRPALFLGRFTFKGDYREIGLTGDQTVWGGEPAADFITNHLRPEEYTIYTKETRQELMRKYRFMPKDDGELYAYQWFWNDGNHFRENIAPPLLIYADLMIKGDKRSIETAQMIYK